MGNMALGNGRVGTPALYPSSFPSLLTMVRLMLNLSLTRIFHRKPFTSLPPSPALFAQAAVFSRKAAAATSLPLLRQNL